MSLRLALTMSDSEFKVRRELERATGIEPRTTSLEAALGSVADQLPVDGDVGRDVCVGASGDLVRHDIFGYPRR